MTCQNPAQSWLDIGYAQGVSRTFHHVVLGDARHMELVESGSVHLVVTSPPYWTLKRYADSEGQLGHIADYEQFLDELDKVWAECYRILVPGGRICCVVGDVCVSRRQAGRHYVMPLPSDIQVRARRLGFDNLTPIMWFKVANITLEASKSSVFLGKPNLPNGIVKNDRETILMLRKPGGYRKPTPAMEEASRISTEDYVRWFQPIWTDIRGASLRNHPAPFPVALAERLMRMFSFAGDTVADPFLGTGTTTLAAINAGRNSIGYEVQPEYVQLMRRRFAQASLEYDVSFVADPPEQAQLQPTELRWTDSHRPWAAENRSV